MRGRARSGAEGGPHPVSRPRPQMPTGPIRDQCLERKGKREAKGKGKGEG